MRTETLTTEEIQKMNAYWRAAMRDKLIDHKQYIVDHGEDMPEVRDWKWRY